MKTFILFLVLSFPLFALAEGRIDILLNGEWEFEQTKNAFPPKKFTRKIPVPGLVHLASPRIEQYEKFFMHGSEPERQNQFNFSESDYTPMYNWYKRKIHIDKGLQGKQLHLVIKKSQYVTMVYVNGMLIGRAIECYTPIEFNITDAVDFGGENEILILVGDRVWLPSQAAGGTDKEKIHYLPGIWDDVTITVTGKIKVDKVLFLPVQAQQKVMVKTRLSSDYPPEMINGAAKFDSCRIEYTIREKTSGKVVATKSIEGKAKRDNLSYFETEISWEQPTPWTPEIPFLYEGEVKVYDKNELTDQYTVRFGMRDFTRKGKFFHLNGEKYYLRGANITLHRFFEDPDCGNLPWDREWVKKLMIDVPKSIDWNAMRICVGLVPDFWYDLCDEYGIVLQNEWLYWQNHGWDEQIRREYTEWVWSDGNHPSIVIWDAINENWNDYVGNTLIPELKQLDPTRIWDAGYMTSDHMGSHDEMDEPHPYRALTSSVHPDRLNEYFRNTPYLLGDLDAWQDFRYVQDAVVPQLINEYGWVWLWRNGKPSKLTLNNYTYFLGEKAASSQACRELQAYWLQLETEWLRSERGLAGVLAFCYLTNNYGFTGDWFINHIKNLEISPTIEWFKHCFAPQAVFINLTDQRYNRYAPPYAADSNLIFNLVGINDYKIPSKGKVVLKLIDSTGRVVVMSERDVVIPEYGKVLIPTLIRLPKEKGGYLLTAKYHPCDGSRAVLSRRYINVGDGKTNFSYFTEGFAALL